MCCTCEVELSHVQSQFGQLTFFGKTPLTTGGSHISPVFDLNFGILAFDRCYHHHFEGIYCSFLQLT